MLIDWFSQEIQFADYSWGIRTNHHRLTTLNLRDSGNEFGILSFRGSIDGC
jgi:hypothetical protein